MMLATKIPVFQGSVFSTAPEKRYPFQCTLAGKFIMRSQVSVSFRNTPPFRIELSPEQAQERDAARQWLDQQFIAMECEPLRPTGKLLMADRVVVVAQAAGPAKFSDPQWALSFAQAASAVLGKPVINVDADSLVITY
jgi:hypothetical protein